MKRLPWTAYNKAKGQPPMSPNEVEVLAKRCDNYNRMLGCAVRVAYLFALRIGELPSYKYEQHLPLNPPYNVMCLEREGILCENIWNEVLPNGDEALYFSIVRQRKGSCMMQKIPALKTRFGGDDKKTYEYIKQKVIWRSPVRVPLLIASGDRTTADYELIKGLNDYMFEYLPIQHKLNLNFPLDEMKWKKLPLFPVQRHYLINKLNHIVRREVSWHMLRQARLTYLSQSYNFSSADLLFFGQWEKDSSMPMRYCQSGAWSIQQRMRDKMQEINKEFEFEKQLNEEVLKNVDVIKEEIVENID